MSEARKGKTYRKRGPLRDDVRVAISMRLKGRPSNVRGKKWWNNGIVSTMSEDCPEGFVSGRLKKNKCKWVIS